MKLQSLDSRDDPRPLWKQVSLRLARMSDAEKAQTLVTAGLFTENLQPKKLYQPLFSASRARKSAR